MLMLGLMIGNAAMHKPFGIENGLGCAAQAVLIYADTTLFARSFYKPSAPVSHTDNEHTEKKKQKQIRKRKQTVAATTTTTTVTATGKEAQEQQQ